MEEISICRIPLSRGYFALVDADDVELLSGYKWHATGKRKLYAARWVNQKPHALLMHRILIGAPAGLMVDHVNGDTLDNRRSNLRLATHKENSRNQAARVHRGTSRYHGVCRNSDDRRWRTAIKVDGRVIHLGEFDSEMEAALAYDEAARRWHGAFATLNFK